MEDNQIIDLYFARSEQAIKETDIKYGGYCYNIAYHILTNREDAEESVNDTYMAAWRNIPPHYPSVFAAFLGKITRNISLDRWKNRKAQKRGGGEVPIALEELKTCIPSGESPEQTLERRELLQSINTFLGNLSETERRIFVCRYWYLDSSQEIAEQFGFSKSKVASMLHRIRGKLNKYLKKEGY